MDGKGILDGGYGALGNLDMNIFLSTLPSEARKQYEEYLQREDKVKYSQFKEWQKEFEKAKGE